MFLEKLHTQLQFPVTYSDTKVQHRQNARQCWNGFLECLRSPSAVDSHFFIVTQHNGRLTYLDSVVSAGFGVGGYDFLRREFIFFNSHDDLLDNVFDVGFLENGILQHAGFIKELIANDPDTDPGLLGFILPEELSIESDTYRHFLSIARHSQEALEEIHRMLSTEVHRVPFKFIDYELELFCPLGYAVAMNFSEYVQSAARFGACFADVQCLTGDGATHLAALHADVSMLRMVIANRSPVNCLTENGYTPLEIAVQNRRLGHVDCLLSANADPNFGLDSDKTVFRHAIALNELDHSTYVRLRSVHTRFDIVNMHGATPLHYNASRFHRDTFIAMVRNGLNPNAKDDTGETPFERLRKDVPENVFKQVLRECQV